MSTLLGKILADFSTSLATDIAVGGTTATLSSATDDDGVALPSGRYFFTLDNSNSSKEHISCDLVGTSLTNIKSVSRQGVETTGVVRKHRIGSSVTLTDFGHIKFINDLISGTTPLNAAAPLGYDGAPAGLTGNQLATVTYVLGVVNGGTVTFDKQIISNQTSGESVTANDIVYFKEADAKWWKADADLTATFNQLQLGVVQETVGADATCSVAISGPVGGFTGLSAGSKYYLSNTAGGVSTSAGTTSVFIGWALNTTTIIFTPEINGALAGSQGVPSSANKYVTQDNLSTGLTDQSQATQNSQSTVGEASTTGLRNKLAQSFIPAKTKVRGVNLYKSADTGTFTGTVTITLQADTAGSPSGSALATAALTNTQWLGFTVGEIEVLFATEYASMTVGSLYWIVIETSTADTSNHPNVGINTAGGYTSGSVKYNNATDSWVAISTIDLYFKTIQGTASQVIKTNTSGKIESAFYDLTEMPTQAFGQTLALSEIESLASPEFTFGSNSDGSVFFIYLQTAGNIYRFARNAAGGYEETHKVDPTIGVPAGDTGAMIVIGIYMYFFSNDGTNIICSRFLAADLTGEQVMTVPVVASTVNQTAWTDGVNAYLVSQTSPTTSRLWSLSGTTFTAVSTATVTNNIFAQGESSSVFDGTTAYYLGRIGGVPTIQKLTNIDGSSRTTTTKSIPLFSDAQINTILINIDSTRMYIGTVYAVYDEAGQISTQIRLTPIAKP